MRVAAALLIAAALLAVPAVAEARPCTKKGAITADGVRWAVYTGDSRRERKRISCRKARRIAKRAINRGRVKGWSCSRPMQRCVRGGRYTDSDGNRRWRYVVGWAPAGFSGG